MTTPAEAAATPASNITTGDIVNSTVVVGNDNVIVNNSAGAVVNVVKSNVVPTERPAPVIVLPKEPDEFIGRQDDLSSLLSASQASATVSLWADNGMGKSSLASTLMHSLSRSDATRSIAYLDAQGLQGDDLARGIYDLFYERPALYLPTRAQMVPQLQQAQALLFIDNLDVPGNDIESLLNVAPKCSFVLISTRRAVTDGKAVRLQGLQDSDAVGLFADKIERPLDDPAKQDAIQICELLKGSPDLIIRMAIRGADNDEGPAQLLAELQAAGLDNKALADLATSGLSANEKKVLVFLAVAGEDTVPLAVLQRRFPDFDVAAALEHLKSLQLVQSHSPRYNLCGSLPGILGAAWDLAPARDEMLQTSIDWLSGQQPSEAVEDSLPLMLQVLRDAADRQKWSEAVRLGRPLERFVFYYTRWQAWAEVLNILLRAAQAIGDRALEGWARHQLGSRALAEGTLDAATTYLSQALKIRESIKDRPGLEVTRHNLDVLKGLGAPAQGSAVGRGGSSARPLTYGFLGLAGIAALAVAGYAIFRPRPVPPATQPVVPPVVQATASPLVSTSTPAATSTSISTATPTVVATDTPAPALTDTPTGIPGTAAPFDAVVTGVDFLACRYGPGAPYMFYGLVALKNGAAVTVLGRADTAVGQWAFVQYNPPYRLSQKLLPCWVSVNYLKMSGDISQLPQVDPHRVLPYFTDPRYVPGVFPPPTVTSTNRDGNIVQVSVQGKDLVYIDDNHADRESATSALFLVEFWVCQKGQQVLNPQGIYFKYDPSQDIASGTAQATDDGSCGQPVHGDVFLAHRDGYVGPVLFEIPP